MARPGLEPGHHDFSRVLRHQSNVYVLGGCLHHEKATGS